MGEIAAPQPRLQLAKDRPFVSVGVNAEHVNLTNTVTSELVAERGLGSRGNDQPVPFELADGTRGGIGLGVAWPNTDHENPTASPITLAGERRGFAALNAVPHSEEIALTRRGGNPL